MSALADRLRGIVQGTRTSAVPTVAADAVVSQQAAAVTPSTSGRVQAAAATLGGTVTERSEGRVIIVDREYRADDRHGRQRIGDLIDTIGKGQDAMATMARAWPSAAGIGRVTAIGGATPVRGAIPVCGDTPVCGDSPVCGDKPSGLSGIGATKIPPLLFLDLETTGLFGGAGTQAFLVGCAAIDGDSIRVRQFLLPGFEHERAVLAEVAAWSAVHGALVTYNGRTFDVPLIETRYLFHRVPFPLEGVPHLDMLHAARRLWRGRPTAAGPDPAEGSCSLAVLEKHLAGLHRIGDVPGFEIPSRYFQFVRDGDARPLEAVLEHNRLDLISLAAVMARAITLIADGPSASAHPHECFGLARLYERAGALENAEAALLRTIDLAQRVGTEPELQADGLRRLAWLRRRSGRANEAAEVWRSLAALPRCPAALRREAREALAIYHEHRSRDLGTARSLVLDVLKEDPLGRRKEEAEHRLKRLERKLAVREQGGLVAALDASLDGLN